MFDWQFSQPDQPESRDRGGRSVDKYVNIFLLKDKTKEQAVADLREMSAEEAFGLLDSINRSLIARKEPLGEGYDPEVTVGGFMVPEGQISKPKNYMKIFNNLWDSIKRDPNLNLLADKLMLSVIYLHIFGDGNGRTARYIWLMINRLASNPLVEDIKVATERPAALQSFFEWLDMDAINDLFKKSGLTNSVIRKFSMRKASLDGVVMDVGMITGTRASLNFLAALRAGLIPTPEGYSLDHVFAVDAKGNLGVLDKPFDQGGDIVELKIEPWTDDEKIRFAEKLAEVEEDFVYGALERFMDSSQTTILQKALKMILSYKVEFSPLAWQILNVISELESGATDEKVIEVFKRFLNCESEEINEFIETVRSLGKGA